MRKILAIMAFAFSTTGALAATVNVDLSGASSGTTIIAPGASFAGLFVGQSQVGNTGISGSPSNPLALQAANNLTVGFFNGSNSILPDNGNTGPLSVLLDSAANSVTFRMGFGNNGSVDLNFFDSAGNVVHSTQASGLSGYANFTYNGFGTFSGFSIFNNTDAAGLRYQDFSYESVDGPSPVPLPAGGLLLISALGIMALRRRSKT